MPKGQKGSFGMLGKKHTLETRLRMGEVRRGVKRSPQACLSVSLAKMGTKNPQWKGDMVGYKCLHKWVRRHLTPRDTCVDCKLPKTLEAANISQKYLRDLSDWEWLCRKCHMDKDGRLKKLHQKME